MDTKLKNSKRNNIVVGLMIFLTISIAAIAMCKSYYIIERSAEKYNSNYNNFFEDYNFTEYLAQASYYKYFQSVDEKSDEQLRPSDVLIDLENKIYSTNKYEYEEYLREFDDEFYNFYARIGPLNNLKYYAYNKENNIVKSNIENGIKVNQGNLDVTEFNKDDYQLYVNITFDENGVVSINDIYGAQKEEFEYFYKVNLKDIVDGYELYIDGYNLEVKPIKNMEFIYAVPKILLGSDLISYGISNAESWGYEQASVIIVTAIMAILAVIALLLPIKRVKDLALFRGLSKIYFEIWCIIILFTVALACISPAYMVKPTLEGNIDYLFGFALQGISIEKSTIWVFNFIQWFICFGIIFFVVLILKYSFNIGIKNYLKTRSIIGTVLSKIISYIKKTLELVTTVNLEEKNSKLIIKLLIINAVILLAITSIWFFGIPVVVLYSIVLFIVIRKYLDKISEKYRVLKKATNKIAEGKLDVKIEEDLGVFEPFKEDLERIQSGFKKAVDEEVKSQKMRTDLISNVSHDLKTPLTAIITYVDLLKDKSLSEEKRVQYIETLERKSQRLQVLIEDLFEMSKASSGNIILNIENVDVVSLMKQTILELDDKVGEANLTIRTNFPGNKVILPLDSQRTFRVFENLVINIAKYAMKGTRVYIDIIDKEDFVEIVLKNMAAEEINFDVETIAERFVRGDESRNAEGSGLGLAIAKSFVELQGGDFNIEVDGDLFKVKIIFEKIKK